MVSAPTFRYVIGEPLGSGGMAEVFAGYVNGLHGFQKPVALKRLLPDLANDEVFVERLIEEAKLLVGMQHGNIVGVLDLARDDTHVFLVMEYVDGPSLRQLLATRAGRLLPFGVSTYIMQAAATGLEFAHARPGGAIIHADVSPSNLLLTTSGEVRVADFGIARPEGFQSGIVEGKWAYMAPEQARGEPLTPASDVFALGVVLYELLTGLRPFGVPRTLAERQCPVDVVRPRVVDPAISPGLEVICMRMLAEDPRDRFARMQHLIDGLVDERFHNHWRDGASELAQAIREVPDSDPGTRQHTLFTEKPVTLMTRSLIVPAPPEDLYASDAYTVLVPKPQRAARDSQARFHQVAVPGPLTQALVNLEATPPPAHSSPVYPPSPPPAPLAARDSRPQFYNAQQIPQQRFAPPPPQRHAPGALARPSKIWAALKDLPVRYMVALFAASVLVGMLAAVVKFACSG